MTESALLEANWREFERIILRALQHAGWTGLMFTSKSHDQGADILGIPPKSNKPVVIQCKHTGSTITGTQGVEDLRRACDFYGTSRGILVTNARLSESGKKRLHELNQHYQLKEWSFSKLIELGQKLPLHSKAKKKPRKYQSNAINLVLNSLNESPTGLVMFATGLGKSIILAEIASFISEEQNLPVLILADRAPLIDQLEVSVWPQLASSQETRLWDQHRKPTSYNGVTIALYQSVLSALRRGTELPRFGGVLIDECHHASGPGFKECINKLEKDYLLGVTATPWRGDNQRITEIFGQPLSTMGIVEGIEKGFLSDVAYEMLLDNVNWEQVSDHSRSGLTIKDLNSRLFLPSRDEDLCGKIVEKWNELGKPQTITFSKSIEHAKKLAALCSSIGMPSKAVYSKGMNQAEVVKLLTEFRSGQFLNLIGVDLLNEGVDVPDVELVVFARVTHSRRIFIQQLGRGLRVTATKNLVNVLDFVADIRRIAEGFRLNHESKSYKTLSYRGRGAELVKFKSHTKGNFVGEYLKDIADLEENDKVNLDFISN